MRLTIFNGSPRGKKSNTSILMQHFIDGFMQHEKNEFEIVDLIHTKQVNEHVELFKKAECVILAFPLYTDAMPGLVKYFIEALEPLCSSDDNPALGFVVQSGFPEPHHSRFVERYLKKLAARLNGTYLGTIVKGGVEGIQMMPPWMTRKLYRTFYQLGEHFGAQQEFDAKLLKKLAPREKMSFLRIQLFKLMQKTGMTQFFWNSQLEKNGVFEQRYDQPYL